MTPSRRAALIAAAKSRAVGVVSCVHARLRPDHLLADCTWEDLAALVVVLAEATDAGLLRAVAEAPADSGLPESGTRDLALRKAHCEFNRLRSEGIAREDMPQRIVLLEREYQRDAGRRQRANADRSPAGLTARYGMREAG